MGAVFVISRAVLAELGGSEAARAFLDRVRPGEFVCTECRRPGWMDEHHPAVVVVVVVVWVGRWRVVRLAHPGCSGSVVRHGEVVVAGDAVLHARGLMRATPAGRQPVLVIASTFHTQADTGGGFVDGVGSGLVAAGFCWLLDMTAGVPALAGLVVARHADGVTVTMPDGTVLFDGPWPDNDEWDDAAEAGRGVLVVWASGLRADNPDRDLLADLFAAIGAGHAVAATAALTTSGHADPSGPGRRAGRRR